MAARKADMKRLIEQRDALVREMDALKNKIAGLEMAISLLEGEETASTSTASSKRNTGVKKTVLDLLREVGSTGLNASTALEIASRRGVTLDRGSVSSLLSRLKSEGTVEYDGEKYRLPEYAGKPEAGDRPSLMVYSR